MSNVESSAGSLGLSNLSALKRQQILERQGSEQKTVSSGSLRRATDNKLLAIMKGDRRGSSNLSVGSSYSSRMSAMREKLNTRNNSIF